ncbi:MAG: 3-hexulose-6-phosphate synthase [Nitrososphaerota archaeon]
MRPILQVALDFTSLEEAFRVAEAAVNGGADWLEIGTPLIKSVGISVVKTIAKRFPKITIVADMKTVDTGYLEARMAVIHGARVVTVLGLASDRTIKEAADAAHEYNAKLMVDLMLVRDLRKRAEEVVALGADYVLLHIGKDVQKDGLTPLTLLREIANAVDVPVAVAGGLSALTAPMAVKAGAKIVVIGSAISSAPDPETATRKIREALDSAI